MNDFNLLPIGNTDFPEIRREGFLYADKTELVYKLIKAKKSFFLSRPRRFGKSLFVSTLKSLLLGGEDNRMLFEGLWIHDQTDYDWPPNPVIHLSLSSIVTDYNVLGDVAPFDFDLQDDDGESGLTKAQRLEAAIIKRAVNQELRDKLVVIADEEKLDLKGNSAARLFESLIALLHAKYCRKVTILIDEYDAPILAEIESDNRAKAVRKVLKSFYSVLKDNDERRGFTFITGVTKFTQTSIFSTLNNLIDLTLDEEFANICGFTMEEFDSFFKIFGPEILAKLKTDGYLSAKATLKDLRDKVLEWYDGYSWDGKIKVLNPWSTLSFFSKKDFGNYWFTTGTPTFLDTIVTQRYENLSTFKSDSSITEELNAVDIGNFETKALLFQAGYLTVTQINRKVKPNEYYLSYPNLEVEVAMAKIFFSFKKNPFERTLLKRLQAKAALKFLTERNTLKFLKALESILSDVNYHLHLPFEAFYQTVFQFILDLCAQPYDSEGPVGDGRYDLHFISSSGDDYVVELKYVNDYKDELKTENNPKSKAISKTKAEDPVRELNRLKTKMDKMAKEAIAQIDLKKYINKFQGGANKIFKVALVIGGRTNTCALIEEAINWRAGPLGGDF
ncbi:MAG: ATP-binding protein [Deltaproteobacteria bacterium]|jgi:hypothetical protein|nr:ATP-binding protein [Deltaproteobacteria bacterium]